MDNETKFYNALCLACGGEYLKISRFLKKSGSWRKAWQIAEKEFNSKLDPDKEFENLIKNKIKLILSFNPLYPPQLKEITLPPFGLYVRGSIEAAHKPSISIVGTRKATEQGLRTSEKLGLELGQKLVVVSGLALGIDAAAHWGAINARGKTIAVIACGLDQIYPAQNKKLADEIIKMGGAIISEYPIKSPSFRHRFLERNRIVSGLSLGTIVIEAPKKSGALATAQFALEQNRDVFAVPGTIYNQNSAGTNNLLKMGAYVVTEANDVLNCLNLSENFLNEKKELPFFDNADQRKIFLSIQSSPTAITIDKISEITKIKPQAVNQSLSFLIISNLVKESGGRYYI